MEIELINQIKDKMWEILIEIRKLEIIQKKSSIHRGVSSKKQIRIKSIELQKLFLSYRKVSEKEKRRGK